MAKPKSLLIGTAVVEAGRLRKCYHNKKHQIQKGDRCLEIREGLAIKGYCLTCAKEMMTEAKRRIDELDADVNRTSGG
jgi:hypothetical protein